jgi:DNA-binding beta-propeller fold protein YncE
MAFRNWSLVSLLCLAAPLVHAQQGRVDGPVAGYVFDGAAHGLRPVLGIPGASVLGDPINLGIDLASATVSPRLDSVIAVAADGSFHFFTLNAGAASEAIVNGIAASPERVVFSPSGTAAALYAGRRIQVVTGLPAAPASGSTFDLTPLLTLPDRRGHSALTGSFAVSDDGALVLAALGAGVQLFGTGSVRQIVTARNAVVAFAPGSHDAAVAGIGVTLVKDVGNAAAQQVVAPDDATQTAVGVAFSADGGKLYLATATAQGVSAFDLSAGTRSLIPCDCTPAGIAGMGNLYRLNEVGSAPLWLLDTTSSGPRIVFVPVKVSL